MPLVKSPSKKALQKNIRTEMEANPDKKDRAQNLAIAYSVQRQAKKKHKKEMAEGGEISASDEKRPMPESEYDDAHNIAENDHKKSLGESDWTDNPTVKQAQANDMRGKTQRIKHPKMVKSDVLQVRLRDEEDDLQSSAAPASPEEQPDKSMDYKSKSETPGPDKSKPHSTGKLSYAKGGKVESSDYNDEDPNAATDSDMHLTPSHDEGSMYADEHEEMRPNRHGEDPDMSEPHSDNIDTFQMAEGGMINEEPDMSRNEEEEEDHDSIHAAVMARRSRMMKDEDGMSGSRDMNEAERARMARGGEITRERGPILSRHATETDPEADQADLRRNAQEDMNHEDKLSFEALEKENYSESEGLNDLDYDTDRSEGHEIDSDEHDMVDSIRKKLKSKWRLSEV